MSDRSQPVPITRWGLLWYSRNLLDGETRHIISRDYIPALFRTRREARAYAHERFGYIRDRADLRKEPHGWRLPSPVRLTIAVRRILQSDAERDIDHAE